MLFDYLIRLMYDVVYRLFDLLASGQCDNKDRKRKKKKSFAQEFVFGKVKRKQNF